MKFKDVKIGDVNYGLFKSERGNFYIEERFYKDYDIADPKMFARNFGLLTDATIPAFVSKGPFDRFIKTISVINILPKQFIEATTEAKIFGKFISNLTRPLEPVDVQKGLAEILNKAFNWGITPEGYDFWAHYYNFLKTLEENENQLQNKDIDRSGDNRSETNRLRCGGNVIEPSTRYSGYEARARKSKSKIRSSKVYISTRCGCVHRG